MTKSERLTDEIKEIGTNKILAYRLKSGVKHLTAIQRLGDYETIGTAEEFRNLKEKEKQRQEWEKRTVVCKYCGYKSLDKLPSVCPRCLKKALND